MVRNLLMTGLMSLVCLAASAQTITLTHDNDNIVNPSSTLTVGTSRTFNTSASCGTIIKLMYYSNPNDISIPDEVYDYTTSTFTHNFDKVGRYYFFCSMNSVTDMSTIPTKAPADQSYNVVPAQAIPTLGEWGLIILSLLFLIISVVAMRSYRAVTQ